MFILQGINGVLNNGENEYNASAGFIIGFMYMRVLV